MIAIYFSNLFSSFDVQHALSIMLIKNLESWLNGVIVVTFWFLAAEDGNVISLPVSYNGLLAFIYSHSSC